MTPTIAAVGLARRYRDQVALDEMTVTIQQGSITGLLGRNGAGKSTFMRIITAQEFATAGTIRVFGEDPVENDAVLRRAAFVREDQQFPDLRVHQAVRAASRFYPNWDQRFAETLLNDFDLPRNRFIKKLSRGMRSALSITLGLASRAELTLLDEPYAGLDAVARQLFYDRLLADYAAHPRTVVLSTHLIDEAADLMEHVLLLDRGRIVLDATADAVRGNAITVSEPRSTVDEFVAGRQVWHRRAVGSRASVTIAGPLDSADKARAAALRLTVQPLSLQQIVVHAATEPTGERATA